MLAKHSRHVLHGGKAASLGNLLDKQFSVDQQLLGTLDSHALDLRVDCAPKRSPKAIVQGGARQVHDPQHVRHFDRITRVPANETNCACQIGIVEGQDMGGLPGDQAFRLDQPPPLGRLVAGHHTPYGANPVSRVARGDYAACAGDQQQAWYSGPPDSLAEAVDMTHNGTWPSQAATFTGIAYFRSEVSIAMIRDGTSNTYMLGEKYLNPDNYTTGLDPADNESMYCGCNDDTHRTTHYNSSSGVGWTPMQDRAGYPGNQRFGSAHPGGWNAAFCDGSVHSISYSIPAGDSYANTGVWTYFWSRPDSTMAWQEHRWQYGQAVGRVGHGPRGRQRSAGAGILAGRRRRGLGEPD